MEQPNRSRMWKLVMIAMLLVLASNMVLAMGLGPSRQYMTFSPGQEIEGELIVINDKAEDFKIAVYAQGDLSNYVTLGAQLLDVSSKESVKRIPYSIKFPSTAPKPGPHKIDIVVRQFPTDAQMAEGTTITANMALISQMIIKVSYPGKYAEGKIYITSTEDLETPVKFHVQVFNFGTENIDSAHARFEIKGPLLGKIAEFNSGSTSIKSKEETRLSAHWTPAVEKGTYKAIATVFFDDKQIKVEKNFDLGAFVIDISDVSVEKFTLGDVAKFDILLANNWNTQMDDVYAELTVTSSEGKEMTKFKTASIDIPAQQVGKLEAYWYTQGVAPGVYKVKLLVHYGGKILQKEYDFEVNTNSMTRVGTVGQVVTAQEEEEVQTRGLLIILIGFVIVLLLVMNIVWFYFLTRQIRGKGGEK